MRNHLPALPHASLVAIASAMAMALAATPAHADDACPRPAPQGFELKAIAPGVYAATRREPPGLLEHGNSLVVIDPQGVAVVDAQMTVAATRELVAAIKRLTRAPVRYVINTHWHDDHVYGDDAYARAWPGVSFVSSTATRAELATRGADNRRQFLKQLPAEIALLRRQLASGHALDPLDFGAKGPLLDARLREAYCSDLAQAESYLATAAATPVHLADITVQGNLTLHLGARELQLIEAGPAHTRGDLAVWLPDARVLATGDAVSGVVPMAAGDADLAAWSASLANLRALHPAFVVPGHGAVLDGEAQLARTQALLDAVRTRATAAWKPGMDAAGLSAAVPGTDLVADWAQDDPVRQLLFRFYFLEPALAAESRRLAQGHGAAAGGIDAAAAGQS